MGYPLLISLSLWFAGTEVDPTTSKVRIASTVLFFLNLLIAVLVSRSAVTRGFPLSLPWGGVSGSTEKQEAETVAEVEPRVEAEVENESKTQAATLPEFEEGAEGAVGPEEPGKPDNPEAAPKPEA